MRAQTHAWIVAIAGLLVTTCAGPPKPLARTSESHVDLHTRLEETLCVYPGYRDVRSLETFQAGVGRPVKYVLQFADQRLHAFTSSVWGQVTVGAGPREIPKSVVLIESIPLAFGPYADAREVSIQQRNHDLLLATARGDYDAYYLSVSRFLLGAHYSSVILRLGWEYDGWWMAWSALGNCDAFQQAFRHVHDLFASQSNRFLFDLTGNVNYVRGPSGVACAWPGSRYVDIIGIDVYDRGFGRDIWDPHLNSWKDPSSVFRDHVLPDLAYTSDIAAAMGKRVSVPEWGLTAPSGASESDAGGDNPVFVQLMFDWMMKLPQSGPSSLQYQCYFNSDPERDEYHLLSHFPNASRFFRALFAHPPSSGETATAKLLPQ